MVIAAFILGGMLMATITIGIYVAEALADVTNRLGKVEREIRERKGRICSTDRTTISDEPKT